MAKSIVAIVGRPNVGKSTLFNKLAGKRISIVEDHPGVTRDRIYTEVQWQDRAFTLIDTGGIEPHSEDLMLKQMKQQAEVAIETAEVIVFLVDGQEGITPSDREVANLLRRTRKKIILAVNKIDAPKYKDNIYEFYNLGLGEPMGISSGQALGLGDLLDEIINNLLPEEEEVYDEYTIKVAVVGKPNVGKSSLVNKILGEQRVIVSDVPGTTRDAIDTPFTVGEDKYVFIDTAGMRKRGKVFESIERYSVIRSLTAIERADVCLMLIDGKEGVSEQDSKIAGYIHDQGKAAVIIVNKWDIVEKDDKTIDKYKADIRNELSFMEYAPILFVSALTGQRVNKVLELVNHVSNQHAMRISTGMLNDVINEAVLTNQPTVSGGRRFKIYYATQVSIKPPAFALFVNEPSLMHFSYQRYLENQIRKAFSFEGTPVRFLLRKKE
ncbi:MAG TPA: ribosome biogenesis GTPase Der [Bacillota bacterium]|nr:ribosome biogenesis GTPase Der [Bacillota bacterium]HNT03168.1 ribosome biogenesis GTPase Der [Bacillota bacterium]HPX68350.1 ribosome biogenesis GTPase Der [Bacillota bacterium]HQA65438.1 ribosome biogenesis GTPase Der [Bacillota bacterium]HQQ45046.1 ribosome biogenesis GTPase Der [Bacillota bacterium]